MIGRWYEQMGQRVFCPILRHSQTSVQQKFRNIEKKIYKVLKILQSKRQI